MDKARKKDFIVRICCLIISFGLWLYISNVENPIRTTVIKNVQVKIVNREVLSQHNLVEVPNQNYTVNVTVRGSTNQIYSLKASQFKLEADISSYALKKGVIRIPVEVKAAPSNINIINPETLWVKLELDNFLEKNVPVKVRVNGDVKDKVKVYDPIVEPKKVLIKGPERYVNEVSYVNADINIDKNSKGIDNMYSVTPVNSLGNKVDHISVEPKEVRIQVLLDRLKTKYVPIEANIKYSNKDKVKSIVVNPQGIYIHGEENELKKIDKIFTNEIDISNVKDNENIEVALRVPKNVTLQGSDRVKVKVEFDKNIDKTIEKTFSLDVKMKNPQDNLEAILETKNVSLIVSSQESKINTLKKEDIECYVDLNSLKEGSYNLPINIKLPEGINKISNTPQNIKVTIKKQEVSENNANQNK